MKILTCFLALAACPAVVFAAELDIGLSYSEGVTNTRSINSAFIIEGKELNISGKIRYAKQNGNVSQSDGRLRFGYDPGLTIRWSLWFFEQPGYDEKREIDLENFAGGGVKYMLAGKEDFEASASAGVLQHHAEYKNGKTTNLARLSFRPQMRWQIDDRFSFSAVAFYQPSMKTFKDYILTGETNLKCSITKRVGLKLKIEDSYRSISMTDENNNFTTVLALAITF